MEIHELKSRLNIVEVATHLGIKVNAQTGKALCPFHNDKAPSLQFSREKNICTCFSTRCNAGTMDIVNLTEKKLQLSTHEALKHLTELAGGSVALPNVQPITHTIPNSYERKKDTEKKDQQQLAVSYETRIAVLKKVFSYFETALLNSKPAKDYMKSRGLEKLLSSGGSPCGYNTGTFHHSQKELLETFVHLGMLKPRIQGGHFVFGKGCVVFPLKDAENQIVGLYYRAISESAKEKHLYLKQRQGLYPCYPNPSTTKVILTESIIDAATLLQIPEIVSEYTILACYGTEGVKEQTEAVSQLKELEEIIFIFDADEPGNEAVPIRAKELHETLPQIKISKVELPEGEDVNGLAVGHEPTIFIELLNQRKSLNFSLSEEVEQPKPQEVKCSVEKKKVEAAPVPVSPSIPEKESELDTRNPYKLIYKGSVAEYAIQGGIRKELDSMRVTLVITHPENGMKSRNKIDLYEDKQVEKISRDAGEKLDLRSDLVEQELNYLTDLLDKYREESLNTNDQEQNTQTVHVPTAERERCVAFGRKTKLIPRINELIGKSGIVGEEKSRIVLFVIASAYKMNETLHVLIQGSSGSGKSHLMEAILSLMPPEDVIYFTRVTESSMYNYGSYELQGKILAYEDWDGLEEKAEYAVRELISKGKITSSTSGKDEQSGTIKSHRHTVYGPVTTFACTTHGKIYEDNMNRVFVIAVDETKEQTSRVINYQNDMDAGIINKQEIREVRSFLQNFMRILKPYEVINPYANKINLPPEADNLRRLNRLFKAFVKQITVLHQYQRSRASTGELITEKEDIAIAIDIMFDSIVLKVDELDGSLRLFYEKLKGYIDKKGKDYEFTQREIRHEFNLSQSQVQRYIDALTGLEYLTKTYVSQRNTHHYKISYWDSLENLRSRIRKHLNDQLENL